MAFGGRSFGGGMFADGGAISVPIGCKPTSGHIADDDAGPIDSSRAGLIVRAIRGTIEELCHR